MLIHVGLETVNLKGKYFTPKVKTGEQSKNRGCFINF